ncbi:hypothetical protein [Pseudomonas sp. WS 5027]|uniref:hypothetical protein n=1 Tax=Pseudomonas sp. WS 5027 TaxID=2717483 RepID=UPI0031FD39C4
MSLYALILIALAVGMYVSLGLTLYGQYKKLDELESYFSENKAVQRNKRFWGRNKRIDRVMRMSILIGFFMQPNHHIKRDERPGKSWTQSHWHSNAGPHGRFTSRSSISRP